MYECPDLFSLPVYLGETDKPAGRKWVFWTADSTYFVGSFDGYRFEPEQAGQKSNAINSLPYAAQTFSGTEEVISMSWLCTKCIGLRTTGSMSLPRVLSLAQDGTRYLLRQKLPEAIEQASRIVGEIHAPGDSITAGNAAIRMLIDCGEDWTLRFYSEDGMDQFTISYRCQGGSFVVTFREVSTFVMLGGSADALDLIFDRGILEISSRDGLLLAVSDVTELRTKYWNKVQLEDGAMSATVMVIQ